MTIARRLTLLLTVPLVVLVGLGFYVVTQLEKIETKSRFVAEDQIESLVALGNISRSVSGMRVNLRDYLLADDKTVQAENEKLYRQFSADLDRQLKAYGDSLISDVRDERMLAQFRDFSRQWSSGSAAVMLLP